MIAREKGLAAYQQLLATDQDASVLAQQIENDPVNARLERDAFIAFVLAGAFVVSGVFAPYFFRPSSLALLWTAALIAMFVCGSKASRAESRDNEIKHKAEDLRASRQSHFLHSIADETRSLGVNVLKIDEETSSLWTDRGMVTITADRKNATYTLLLNGQRIQNGYQVMTTSRETDLGGNPITVRDGIATI